MKHNNAIVSIAALLLLLLLVTVSDIDGFVIPLSKKNKSNVMSLTSRQKFNKRHLLYVMPLDGSSDDSNTDNDNNKNSNDDDSSPSSSSSFDSGNTDDSAAAFRRQLETMFQDSNSDKTKKNTEKDDSKSTNKSTWSKNKYKKKPISSAIPSDWMDQILYPPPLTSTSKQRYEVEIRLLRTLSTNDAAIEKLWQLWYHSHGPIAAKKLEQADLLVSQGPRYYDEAEQLLRRLIQEYGIHFIEAINRLATLNFLQSRFAESKELCQVVLKAKPWHFGALSGIVMVCQQLQDMESALHWALKRMPPLLQDGENQNMGVMLKDGTTIPIKSRKEWVKTMVREAQARYILANNSDVPKTLIEVKEMKGIQDEMIINDESDDNAWQ